MIIRDAARIPSTGSGNLFYSRPWLDVLTDEYGFEFKAIVDESETTPRALLLFANVTDIFGERVLSLPFSDYTEPVVADQRQLFDALALVRDTYASSPITIRLHGEADGIETLGFSKVRRAFCHRISLKGSLDDIWKRTDHAFRKGVNTARRHGLRIEIDNTRRGVEIHHSLLSKLRRQKYHILAQPLSFYLAILRRFLDAGLGNIWVVYRDDKPIASAVLLHHGVGVYDKMGVSDEEHLNVRPNNFLLWEAIQHGHGHGFEFLDMGLSQIDYTGLIRFKESVGGIASAINYYRYTPPAFDVVRETNIKRLLSSLTDFLVKSDLPTPALEPAAALLYRYFS